MIDNLVVKRPNRTDPGRFADTTSWISCTYCWYSHPAHHEGDKLVLITSWCGFDPRRYFLSHEEYIAYVRRYKAEGHRHIDEWEGRQLEMDSLVIADV